MERSCLTCGVVLQKKPGPGRWPKWCQACRASDQRRPRVCPECTATFVRRPARRWCGRRCRTRFWQRQYYGNRRVPHVIAPCTVCDELFESTAGASRDTCSTKCTERKRAGLVARLVVCPC